jgi:hypothetical protein
VVGGGGAWRPWRGRAATRVEPSTAARRSAASPMRRADRVGIAGRWGIPCGEREKEVNWGGVHRN